MCSCCNVIVVRLQFKILNDTVCISHSAKSFWKGGNPIIHF